MDLLSMNMTLEGSALVAGLYPVGVFLLVLEARAIAKTPRIRLKGGVHSRASLFALAIAAVIGFSPVGLNVTAVGSGVAISGLAVIWTSTAGWILNSAVIVVLIEFLFAARATDSADPRVFGSEETSPPAPPRGVRIRAPRARGGRQLSRSRSRSSSKKQSNIINSFRPRPARR